MRAIDIITVLAFALSIASIVGVILLRSAFLFLRQKSIMHRQIIFEMKRTVEKLDSEFTANEDWRAALIDLSNNIESDVVELNKAINEARNIACIPTPEFKEATKR